MAGCNFNREVFVRLWNDHAVPTRRIADAMGITRAGVSWHAHRMGLPSRAKVRARKADPHLLKEMWLAGVASAEIAAHFGMADHSCATQVARKLGLPRRKRGPSGKRNGGWVRNLPIQAFFEARLAAQMAATAAIEQSHMINAEMVDIVGNYVVGVRHARRVG